MLLNRIEKKSFFDLNYICNFYKDVFSDNQEIFNKKIYKD